MQEPNYIAVVSEELGLKNFQVEVVLDLINEGATVPFIARYRKERTGNLDEDNIRDIISLKNKTENLYKAKITAINGIEEMGKMTPELMQNIVNAKTLKEVEEIYKPYKSKKKTKAMIAIEKGFQVVADSIKKNGDIDIPKELLKEYNKEEILEGSVHIIAAEVSANTKLREALREYEIDKGILVSKLKSQSSLDKLNEKDTAQIKKFDLYTKFESSLQKLKPYQILALNRGEKLGILNVKIEKNEAAFDTVKHCYARILNVFGTFIAPLAEAFKDGFDVLFKSVEKELRADMSEEGEDDSIHTFQKNLESLLMTKPEYGKKVLAIDPGYKAGCKIAILNEFGTPIGFEKIYLHSIDAAKKILQSIFEKNNIEVVVIGNGTGVDETRDLVQSVTQIDIYIVNESGASVYSASQIAKEEFPDLDSLDRGTVSIGRRYIDPLSELVKIPVESIGVGMYQHDIPVKKLEEKLGYVVEDVVNEVGINVNTASSYVLNHISGIDKRNAKKIFNHRPYRSRKDLQKVLSDTVYQQAIGFLRVPDSKEVLDNTDIHPEQYELAKYICTQEIQKSNFGEHQEYLLSLYPDVTLTTLEFIHDAYDNIGKDPRQFSSHQKAKSQKDIAVIKEGDITEGVVRNVVAFGAFVDIGLKNDGLVHISELANQFVKDPMDFVEVGQKVKVKITSINDETGKIQLSMKQV